MIDTGFNGFLTLPAQLINDLGLPFIHITSAQLGDGSEVHLEVFEATVLWDGEARNVNILSAAGGPLVGMSMLSGYRVTVEVEHGGSVVIESLAS